MSKAALQTVRDAVKRGEYAPAYYIIGDDDYQKEDAVRQLEAGAVEPSTKDFNLESRRAADLNAEILASLLSTPPMMAERRALTIREIGGLKKDARKVLDSYLGKPAADVVVIMTDGTDVKSDKSLAERTTTLQFDHLTGDRLPKWIAHQATTAHGVSISPSAIELLQTSVGSDLRQLSTELDKLSSYTQGSAIDEIAVAAIVGINPGESLGDFLDAVGARDASKALALVPQILGQPKVTGVSVVMALSTQMLALAWGSEKLGEGVSRNRLAQEYFALLRETGAYAARSWGGAASAWTKCVTSWTALSITSALETLLDADIALKESRVSTEEQILNNVVLALCAAEQTSEAA